MAQKVCIEVEARFVDNVSGAAGAASSAFKKVETSAKAAAAAVDSVGKKKASPDLEADTSKFRQAIDDSDRKLAKFGRSRASAKLEAEDKATTVIAKVISKVKGFAGKVWSGVVTIKDYVTSGLSKVLRAVKGFAGRTYSAMVKIRDSEALSSIRKITSGAEKLVGKTWTAAVRIKDMATAPLRTIKNMLFSIKSLVLAITAGLAAKSLIVNPINLADQYSSAKIGFSTLLGETAGQQMMNDLDAFAKKTPFKTSGVISAAQKMMAMGWDSENIIGDLEVLGNAAAATGNLNQGLESIVRAMSQIKTKGRLSTEELNQLAEAGIAAKAMLAEQLGYGTGDEGIAKMTEDLEKGAIASDKAIAALMAGMQKYNGMMDSMANETVEGLWSQIQDTFEINVFRKWGQGLQDGAKKGFGTILQLLDASEDALSEFGDLLYDIGKKISNWFADKFQKAVDKILKITDSFEFKEASLGEKIAMLWKNVVADPIKKWFSDLWTDEENIEKATSFGKSLAEGLTKGILAILGITDIFAETGEGAESEGSNIAQGFAKGFVEGFDVSAITSKIVEAIGNVWNALPTWAKIVLGTYGAGKIAGGIGSFIGGVANFAGQVGTIIGHGQTVGADGTTIPATGLIGLIGKTGTYAGGGYGLMGGLSKLGYMAVGSLAGAGALGGTGTMAMYGLSGGLAAGAALGGLTAGVGTVYAGNQVYNGYQSLKAGDETSAKASFARANGTIAGIGAGALAGAKIGGTVGTLAGPVGTAVGGLIGAGVGTVVGWLAGDTIARNIEAAAYETKEMQAAIKDSDASAEEVARQFEASKYRVAKQAFGDISLSMEEIARLSQQVVFGEDLEKYDKFAAAAKQAEASLQALKTAGEQTDRWMWKAGLGVTFNEDEVSSIKASFDDYINSAKSYVENKHYEFTASAELLLNLESEEGKSILESGNAYYAQVQEKLNNLGSELNSTLEKVLKDGVISTEDTVKIKIGGVEYELNEQDAVAKLQEEIARITKQIEDAEADAALVKIDLKFGEGRMTMENFEDFLAMTQQNLDSRMSSADTALEAQIATLNLRFPKDKRNSEQYKKELQTIIDSYNLEVETITAEILGFELEIIGEAFGGPKGLGDDAVDDLNNMINHCIEEGITPAELSLDKIIELSGNPELSQEKADKIKEYLSGIFDQLDLSQFELVEVDGKVKLQLKTEVNTEEGTEEKVKETVDNQVPDVLEEKLVVKITGDKQIEAIDVLAEEFGIQDEVAASVILKLNAADTVTEQVDILASEFEIPPEVAEEVLVKVSGDKAVAPITVTAEELCPTDEVTKVVNVRVVANYLTGEGGYGGNSGGPPGGFRGGIFGGTSAMGSYARGGIIGNRIPGFSNGGIVRGGSQLIEVAEEGSPEMVIPLSSQRRGRALKLWAQAGNIMGVPGFARGGIIGGNGSSDEGIRFHTAGSDESTGSQSTEVNMGGVTVQINVTAGNNGNIVEAIREQSGEIAEVVAGILADAMGGQFENTPVRGGVA